MSKLLCIYHGHCDDGFTAAYAVREYFRTIDRDGDESVEFYAGVYQQEPPNVAGRDVLLVDFSYKQPVLRAMAESARSLLILDHHKTALEDLAGLPSVKSWADHQADAEHCERADGQLCFNAVFDLERSGAGIAWDFFMGSLGEARPLFIDYVEDRDLWRKRFPGGDEFTIALRSYPQTFEAWDRLFGRDDAAVARLIQEGGAIGRYYQLRVEELKRSAYRATLTAEDKTYRIAIANAPYFAASDLAGALRDEPDVDFGASYFEVRRGVWQYSLRSKPGFDVSAVAKCFGGGGHENAAGFSAAVPVHDRA